MPFKSKAQVRKFGYLLSEGKITQEQFDEWHASTPNIKKLPERVKAKGKAVKKKKGFGDGFKKVAAAPVKPISNSMYEKILKGTTRIKPEGKIDGALRRYNNGVMTKQVIGTTGASIPKPPTPPPLKKVGLDMAAQEAITDGTSMTDFVPGTSLRDTAETGQARGRATRTKGVRNEDKEFFPGLKTKYDTARGGRRYGYN